MHRKTRISELFKKYVSFGWKRRKQITVFLDILRQSHFHGNYRFEALNEKYEYFDFFTDTSKKPGKVKNDFFVQITRLNQIIC